MDAEMPQVPADESDRYRQLFDLSSDSLFLIDRDSGALLDANKAASTLYGYARDELLSMCNTDLSAEPDQTRTALRSEQPHVLVRWHRKKSGTVFPVEITASYMEQDGKVLQLAAIRDISTRLAAQRAQQESDARFAAFMDRVPYMVFIKDSQLRTVYANRAMQQAFPVPQWLGKLPDECFPPDVAAKITASDKEALERGTVTYTEERPDSEGTRRTLRILKFRIDLPGEEPLLGAIISDVSDERTAQEALINSRRIESLGALAGGIAHEFNNLLTGLFGPLSLARAEAVNYPLIAGRLDLALSSYNRAQNLSARLLTFSRGGEPRRSRAPIAPIIEERVQFAMSGALCSTSFEFDPQLWPCEVDAQQIGQALNHLAQNAREAMPNGGLLRVSARNVGPADHRPQALAAGSYICIEVKDSGPGITADQLPHVFDPFFTTKGSGRGLGLATAYSILSRHGGTLEVVSTAPNGATFRLYLPAVPTQDDSAAAPSPVDLDSGRQKAPCRVLVVDDEKVIRSLLEAALRKFGCDPVCLSEGTAAIAAHRQALEESNPFSWAILDLTIPRGMGGLDAAALLSAAEPGLPIIATSGYSDHPVMARPQEFGFVDSLCKPFRIADIEELVLRMQKPAKATSHR